MGFIRLPDATLKIAEPRTRDQRNLLATDVAEILADNPYRKKSNHEWKLRPRAPPLKLRLESLLHILDVIFKKVHPIPVDCVRSTAKNGEIRIRQFNRHSTLEQIFISPILGPAIRHFPNSHLRPLSGPLNRVEHSPLDRQLFPSTRLDVLVDEVMKFFLVPKGIPDIGIKKLR